MKKRLLFIAAIILLIPFSLNASTKEGFITKNGYIYLYKNGVLQKGITEYQGNDYFLGEYSGKAQIGLVTSSLTGKTYYMDQTGKILSGFFDIDGATYYFNKDLKKGIIKIDGEDYFLGEYSGKAQIGLVTSSLTGKTYYMDQTGKILSGFFDIDGATYYFNKDLKKGITKINGEDYFLGEYSGKVQKGLVHSSLSRDYYYTNEEGKIYKGDFIINEEEYSSYETGILKNGFIKENDNTYYYEIGRKIKGPYEIKRNIYFFGEVTGKLQYGWITSAFTGNKYYAGTDGVVKRGVHKIDGHLYFLGELTGKLQYGWIHSLTGSIYYANEEGILLIGKQTIDGKEYNFKSNGQVEGGFLTIGEDRYFIDTNGKKLTGIHKLYGIRYRFDADGRMTDSNFKLIADISYYQGTINWDALWSSKEIDGVILRLGYATVLDSKFEEYLENIKRLKIPYTIYLFSYAQNATEALEEAVFTIEQIRKYNLDLNKPVYYDIESWKYKDGSANSDNISKQTYQEIIENYIWALNANSYDVKVYTGWYYARDRLTAISRQQVDWIAHYTNYSCGYKESHSGWQFTSTGKVTGIKGNVDLSIFY